ncbi:hypothetical protein A5666_00090 [Mycolicibacterium fortuitum]|uniref:hypothetical protein n=1 Tax=Mycolicibacterium fortuitum TaxID=1766 RepID=UPI0007EA41FA|nr:hypothetical protein [Mycolicibacterium fortuitum]OBA92977.1 hypothetical protein A5665_10730 [Mycolicibacterium fortuitum]OBI66926.1 hypothetical protein A5666_00090 [Mycolicibacterium fortuitum]
MSGDVLERREAAALYLCDLGLPAIAIHFGVAYASSRAFAEACGMSNDAHVEFLLAAELHRDPDARAAADRITPAAQAIIRAQVDAWWTPTAPAPAVTALIPRGVTADMVGRAARELAAERGGQAASVLYIGAVAEAEIRGVNVASLILGNADLVVAYRQIIADAERGRATCADLVDWLMQPTVWAGVIERAGVLAAVERIAVEAGLERAA